MLLRCIIWHFICEKARLWLNSLDLNSYEREIFYGICTGIG